MPCEQYVCKVPASNISPPSLSNPMHGLASQLGPGAKRAIVWSIHHKYLTIQTINFTYWTFFFDDLSNYIQIY